MKKLALCSLLTALALALSFAERWIPLGLIIPVPGVKLGLANVVTLFALVTLKKRQTAAIVFCRVFLTALMTGSVTGFWFGICGGFLAMLTMAVLLRGRDTWFSIPGISVAGAAAHNIGQIGAAIVWLGTRDVIGYLPFLLVSGIVMGLMTGAVCYYALGHLEKIQKFG